MDKKTKIAVNIFNENAEAYNKMFGDQKLYADSFNKFLQLLSPESPQILELGCGPGNIAAHLFKQNSKLNYLGTDLAEKMLEVARRHNPLAKFELLDCRDVKSLNQNFDGVICGFCFPYIDQEAVAQLIKDIHQSLNPKGLIYISTMEGEYESSGYKASSSGKGPKAYIHYYPQSFLVAELEKNGFKLHYNKIQEFPFENTSATQDLILIAQKN